MSVIIGVTASIAIYKTCDLVRNLTKAGIEVKVAMTKNAQKWINPIIFAALSEHRVYTGDSHVEEAMPHIEIRQNVDLMIVAPATANFIARAANGMANDIITTTLLSYDGPKLIAPSMNPHMYSNSIVQENIFKLKKHGIEILDPQNGETVCGDIGLGKMMTTDEIEKIIKTKLA